MPFLESYKVITVADGVNGTVSDTENEGLYYITGTETLTGNWQVSFSGTPVNGMHCVFIYQATVTLDGNDIIILGATMPSDYAAKEVIVNARYNGASWDIVFTPGFEDTDIINTAHIQDSAITAAKLDADAVTTIKILDANVTDAKLNTNSVTTAKITDLNVTEGKLAANAVTTAKINNDAVTADKIASAVAGNGLTGGSGSALAAEAAAAGAISVAAGGISVNVDGSTVEISGNSLAIKDDGVTTAKILDSNVTTAKIADGDVTDAKLAGSIAVNKLVAQTANRVLLSDGSGYITPSSVTNTTLGYLDATSSIQTQLNAKVSTTLNSAQVLVGSSGNVATARTISGDVSINNTGVVAIAAGAVVNADVNAAAGINFSKLEALATGSIVVGNGGTPTAAALSGDATISAGGALTIANDAITTAKIADSNVTTAKIADGDVTAAKLDSDSVTTVKILDDNVTTAKINDGAVNTAKLADNNKLDMIIAYASFESGFTGTQYIRIPYKCTLTNISAGVIKNIDAANDGEITFQDNGGNNLGGSSLTTGKLTVSQGDTIGTQTESTATSNNAFSAGDDLRITTGNATSGICVISIELTRAD